LQRVPLVEADPTELVGRFTGRVIAADLIMDDQEAVVQEGARLDRAVELRRAEHQARPDRIGQRDMARLDVLRAAGGDHRGETSSWTGSGNRVAATLVAGVRMRMNYLACAMMLDTFSYNRLGVNATGTWGKPSALKPSAYSDWAVAATGTPINDIRTLRRVAIDNYGVYYNRATMSTLALRYALATDEFKAAAVGSLGFAIDPAAVAALPDAKQREVFSQLAEVEIVLDDAVYQEKANAGTFTSTRYLPAYKVILDTTDNDKNEEVWDFANTAVTESQMEAIRNLIDIPADAPGPIAYYTAATHDANPPGTTAWGVARAFPRSFIPERSAVLTAGTFTS
jgi:hypothetical protein